MIEYQYSQNELAQLAACAKRVTEAPRREMKAESAHRSNDFEVESTDGQHRFKAFFRQNQTFPENFSLGLDYLPGTGGRFPILRVTALMETVTAASILPIPTLVLTFTEWSPKTWRTVF